MGSSGIMVDRAWSVWLVTVLLSRLMDDAVKLPPITCGVLFFILYSLLLIQLHLT